MIERVGGVLSKYDVVVVPGFLGVTSDGRYTSLGRVVVITRRPYSRVTWVRHG